MRLDHRVNRETERRGFCACGCMSTSFRIVSKNDNVAGFCDFCLCHNYVTAFAVLIRRPRSRERITSSPLLPTLVACWSYGFCWFSFPGRKPPFVLRRFPCELVSV